MCKSSSGLQTDHGSRGNFPPSLYNRFLPNFPHYSSSHKTGQLRVICSPRGDIIHSLFSCKRHLQRVFRVAKDSLESNWQSQINQHCSSYIINFPFVSKCVIVVFNYLSGFLFVKWKKLKTF